MEAFQNVLKLETDLIIWIQNNSFKYEPFLSALSHVFGSSFFYAFIIPLFAAFNTRLYNKLIISAVASDFLNLIFKWILAEDRPYWWVSETKVYTSLTRPTLYQTEKTCETSPGSPSGHLTFASAVFYVLVIEGEEYTQKHYKKHSNLLKYVLKALFVTALALLSISRMYFATHFLHQCLLGIFSGISISKCLISDNYSCAVASMRRLQWIKIWLGMIALVFIIYWIQKLFNIDPMLSVKLAFKYCLDPFHPRPETTIMFGCIRCFALVAGIWYFAPLNKRISPDSKLNYFMSIPVTLIIMAIRWIAIFHTPKTLKLIVFYAYTFSTYSVFQFCFLFLLPRFCMQKVLKPKEK